MGHGRKHSRAFTLIELLAVVAVIILLLSILVPTMGAARKRAGLVPCMNNLRQLYSLCVGYAGDNAGDLPQGLSENGQMLNMNHAKFKMLNQYMENFGITPKIWYCPSLPPQFGNAAGWGIDAGGTPGEFLIGYFYVANVTTGSLWKFKATPPKTLQDLINTNGAFVWDVCKAYRPAPIPAAEVSSWWIFPHYSVEEPAVCQYMMGNGSVTKKKLDELQQRYNYIHPGEIYW